MDKPYLWLVSREEGPPSEGQEPAPAEPEGYDRADELARSMFDHLEAAMGGPKWVSLALLGRAIGCRILQGEELDASLLAFTCGVRWLEARGVGPPTHEEYRFASEACHASVVVVLAEHGWGVPVK